MYATIRTSPLSASWVTTVTGLNDYPMSAHPMINITVPGSFNNTRLGTWFETSVNLSTSIYAYGFSVWDKDSNWTFTNVDIGPLTAPADSASMTG